MALPEDDLTGCIIIAKDEKTSVPHKVHSWPIKKSIAWRQCALLNGTENYFAGKPENTHDVYLMEDASKGKLTLVPADERFNISDVEIPSRTSVVHPVRIREKTVKQPVEIAAQDGIEFSNNESAPIGKVIVDDTIRPVRKAKVMSYMDDLF